MEGNELAELYGLLYLEKNAKLRFKQRRHPNGQRYIETMIVPSAAHHQIDPAMRMQAALMEADSAVKIHLETDKGTYAPRGTEMKPVYRHTPEYIMNLYQEYEKETGDSRPMDKFMATFLTGTSTTGVCDAIAELCTNDITPHSDVYRFVDSLYITFQLCGYDPGKLVTAPSFSFDAVRAIGVPSSKSAGVNMVDHEVVETKHFTVEITYKGKKEDLLASAQSIIHTIHNSLKKSFDSGDFRFNDKIYPIEVTVMFQKVEPTDDPTKNRLIFISDLVSYILLKMINSGPIKSRMRRGPNRSGWSWWSGDAQRMWNEMKDCVKLFDLDFRRLDKKHYAAFIQGYLSANILYYTPGETNQDRLNYFILRHHYCHYVGMVGREIVQWPDGEWRILRKMMKSGAQYTTDGNTMLVIANTIDFMFELMMDTSQPEIAEMVKNSLIELLASAAASSQESALAHFVASYIRFCFFGDNGALGSTSEKVAESFNLKNYIRFTNAKGYEIQEKSCNEMTSIFSRITTGGELVLRDWIAPSGQVFPKPHGLEWLKHYFVKVYDDNDKGISFPFKPTSAYWSKVGKTGTDLTNPMVGLCRIFSQMLDTVPNHYGYRFLEKMSLLLQRKFPDISLADVKESPEAQKEFSEIMSKFYYSGIVPWANMELGQKPDYKVMEHRLVRVTTSIDDGDLIFWNSRAVFDHVLRLRTGHLM